MTASTPINIRRSPINIWPLAILATLMAIITTAIWVTTAYLAAPAQPTEFPLERTFPIQTGKTKTIVFWNLHTTTLDGHPGCMAGIEKQTLNDAGEWIRQSITGGANQKHDGPCDAKWLKGFLDSIARLKQYPGHDIDIQNAVEQVLRWLAPFLG